ncbi:MAG: HIRAN domain-containing protein, partial [Eggerthellaceae bacterium]|nr:HIRAN domain-containing protein [Eggerthellaceae bacterium]
EFFVAGFRCYDGALVLGRLQAGAAVDLVPEFDNPYDRDAIEIRYEGVKLGYVPASKNASMALMAFYGHADVFEARILQVDSEADPWEQVRVGIYVRDARCEESDAR